MELGVQHIDLMHWGPCPKGKPLNPATLPARTPFNTRREADFVEQGCIFMLVKVMATSPTDILNLDNTSHQASKKSLGEVYYFRNHVHSPHFCIWKRSSSQYMRQTSVHRQTHSYAGSGGVCPASPLHTGSTGQRHPDPYSSPAQNMVMLPTEPTLFCFRNNNHLLYTSNF